MILLSDIFMSEPQPSKLPIYIASISLVVMLVIASTVGYFYVQTRSELSTLQGRFDNLQSRLENLGQTQSEGTLAHGVYVGVEQSVVQVLNMQRGTNGLTLSARGTGFTYDGGGHIITNEHVVAGADAVEVSFLDGTTIMTVVVGTDIYSDLAVLKVQTSPAELKPVTLGNSSQLLVGETIYAVGAPFGLGWSLTQGIVSQIGRSLPTTGGYVIPGEIQVDAAINPGNSGGPLLNSLGEVVGVNEAIESQTGQFSGVGFAIPSNLVKRVVPLLIRTGHYDHPWLGVAGIDVTSSIAEKLKLPETRGFLVTSVMSSSPAEKAGVLGGNTMVVIEGNNVTIGGDVITGIDGRNVNKLEDMLYYIEYFKNPGDKVVLNIIRDNKALTVEVALGARPAPSSP
jgi:S1-C subfamily serine protease